MPITTKVVSSNRVQDEVYSKQHYLIKFVNDFRQVGGFLWALRFPQPIKLTAMITEILVKMALNIITLNPNSWRKKNFLYLQILTTHPFVGIFKLFFCKFCLYFSLYLDLSFVFLLSRLLLLYCKFLCRIRNHTSFSCHSL